MTTKNQQDENPVDQVAKLIKNGELEEIKKITTPSGLEKLAEKQGQNILEFSLMVSDQLKRSPEGSHHKELADLGHNVEEYARNLLHWFEMRITIKEIPCIDRITYAAIHYKCKKFLSGPTTQNHLNKVWTRRYHKESDVSVKWILFNLFALFEVIFFPLIFVVYGYGIIKDRSKDDESNDHSSENHESDHPRSKNGESDHPRSKNGESDHLRSKNGESDNRRSKNYKSDDGSKRLQGVLEQYTDRFHIPYFVFVRDTLSYVALLMLHIAVCVQPSGLRLSVLEWFIMVFFIGRFMQEIDQFISERDEIHDLKTNYSNDFWNKLDVVTIVLFVITFIFRLVTWSLTSQIITNDWLVVTSLFYGINAILLSLRVFGQAMEVKKTTGTKQIALLRIISAVFVIFVQMVAAILGFSLILTKIYVSEITYVGKKATHGVCLSSDGILCWWHFFEFLAWSTVGSSDPDLLTLTTSVPNYISKTFYMLFLIVAAVMIMNMLIALLSNIYQLVEENAYDEWCYRKACLIKTYYNYHPVPVPFNIITLSIKLIYMIFSKLNPKRFKPCQEKRKDEQESIKQELTRVAKFLNADYLAEFGNFLPLQESPEEKILKRNQRLLRQIVREVYSEETKLNERCDWEIVNKARTVLMENQRMYILKCDNCDKAENIQKQCIHSVRYKHKLSEETPGFEVLIEFAGTKRRFGIGLTSKWYGNRYPGWREDSVGYHADTGRIHDKESHQFGRQLGASIQAIDPFPYTGDMIGCNVKFDDKKDDEYLVQFTRNRRLVGEARAKPDNLFPFVTMAYPEIKLLFRFVKKGESGFKNNTELSNQNEVDRLSKEIGVIKEICLRQNEKMEQLLMHVYRSMPSDEKQWNETAMV